MRTESQIKRKLNELQQQQQALQTRKEAAGSDAERDALNAQLERLGDMIDMLEWVLNAPIGSYHV
ncbi:hypothetical protein [Paenibacillus aestuarii]|uniref:Uncharacterized protein n=1 Tax=Paenibacillus aestuarii TaxID=516965 RepID=A0ABW0K3W3_9BACL|nr:hypothetical protein [Paenibacillus aestuarii]